MSESTRKTVRTAFQGLLALALIAPLIVQAVAEATGYDVAAVPFVAVTLAVLAAVTKVMNLPQVEAFLRTYLPFLAASVHDEHADDEAGEYEPKHLA